MADDGDLLFFDTFSHETTEELNLDLVQFPRPVYVHEIRIIPLGSRVAADFPGGHRLGATNPSTFKLEFFINDLTKRGACTFDRAGCFEYKQNVDIQFIVTNKVPTDGLVIRGWYSTVTVAVYGTLAKVSKDRGSSPPPSNHSSRQTTVAPTLAGQPQPIEPHPTSCTKDNVVKEATRDSDWDCGVKAPPLDNSPPPPPPFPPVHPEPPRFTEPPPPPMPIPEAHPVYTKHPPVQYQEQPQYSERQTFKFEVDHYQKTWPPAEEQYTKKTLDVYKRPTYEGPQHHYHGNRTWEKHDLREGETFRQAPHREDHRDREKDRDYENRKRRDHRDKEVPWEHTDSRYHREWIRERDHRDSDRRGRSQEPVHDRPVRVELEKRPPSPRSPSRSPRPKSPPPPPEFESKAKRESDETSAEPAPETGEDIFEPVTPDNSPSELYNLSDGEIQEVEQGGDDMLYEEILSEEENMSDEDERSLEVGDVDYDIGDDTWNLASSFNPYHCEFVRLQHFLDPGLSAFEVVRDRASLRDPVILTEDAKTLVQCLHQFTDNEHDEKWVEALENVSSLISNGLAEIQDKKLFDTTTDTLLQWCKIGLDFDLAMAQTQAPFKLRHLKAGIKLTGSLLVTCTDVVDKMLEEGVAKWLLDLYGKPFMSRPVKLLILQAIDALTFTSQGILYLLEKKMPLEYPDTSVPPDQVSVYRPPVDIRITTGYQKLLDIFMSKESTRSVIGFSSLMQKLHFYEALLELHNEVDKISQSMMKDMLSSPPIMESETDHSATSDVESDLPPANAPRVTVTEEQMDMVIGCISEVTNVYENAHQLLLPPALYLPATCQFEIAKSTQNPYPNVHRLLRDCHFIESILVLLSSPVTSSHGPLLSAIRDLFGAFSTKNSGIQFLYTKLDVLNAIPRALFQEENREENNEDGMSHQIALQLVSTLQAFQYIDALLAYHHKEGTKDLDDTEVVSILHQLYLMTFSPVGKMAVIHVLATESNMEALIPLLEFTDSEETNSRLSKSVCCGYATELLLLTVHHNESVEFLLQFLDRLQGLAQQESMSKLQELSNWLSPLKKVVPNLSCEAVIPLMALIKTHLESNSSCLAPELITTLRILRHLTVPPTGFNKECPELKYQYALLQLFGSDGMELFLKILQEVCEQFLKPAQLSSTLSGTHGAQVLSVIKPIITMLHLMLASVISCRGTEFKDLTVVPVLLKLYSLMTFFPISSYMHPVAQQVLNEIIEILLTYTQPFLEHLESEEALSKSLWTQMVQEVLKYTTSCPNTWITGLAILSELLPLPLPLQTKQGLSSEETEKVLNCRKLWSAHLHSLNDLLKNIILTTAGTACQPLQQLLRRICVQLSDLAAPTTTVVVRAVLEGLYESIGVSPVIPEEVKDEKGLLEKPSTATTVPPSTTPVTVPTEAAPEMLPCSFTTARILNFLSFLVSHATFKVAFLHVLKGNAKVDDHYTDFLNKFLCLLNLPSIKPSHLHAQECLVSIFQSLCDPEIGLITFDNGAPPLDVLASSLPSPELLKQVVSALVQHVGETQMSFSSILPCLRTLVMITEHDLGFLCLKAGLEANPHSLHSLLSRLRTGFSKDSSDCLSTLSTVVELLRLIVQGYEEGQAPLGRTFLLSPVHLLDVMSWEKKTEKGGRHPLIEIEKLLLACSQEDEVLEGLLENVSGVIGVLNEGLPMKDDKSAKGAEYPEVSLSPCESLAVQFSSRPVFLLGEIDEERLLPAYWLGLPCGEDPDPVTEQVTADLIAMAEKYLPDFDLRATLEKLCSADDKEKDPEKKLDPNTGKRKYTSLGSASNVEAPSKKPFIAPMRGRQAGNAGASGGIGNVGGVGFTRVPQHAQPRNDPFRSRPPNTSRPPSMHVDDFLAMEGSHPQPQASSQPIPKRVPKETPRGRGRGVGFDMSHGFGVARGSGGRFFTPPASYSRREPGGSGRNSPSRLPLVATSLRSGLAIARPLSLSGGQGNSGSGWPGRSSSNSNLIAHAQTSLISPKISPTPSMQRAFGRGSHADRLTSPRVRDPYSLSVVSSSAGGLSAGDRGGRFGHNSRGGNVGVLPSSLTLPPTHWSDPRLKIQDQRFLSNSVIPRGRRELGSRHARSFTR